MFFAGDAIDNQSVIALKPPDSVFQIGVELAVDDRQVPELVQVGFKQYRIPGRQHAARDVGHKVLLTSRGI